MALSSPIDLSQAPPVENGEKRHTALAHFPAHLLKHPAKTLSVSASIIDRIVGVLGDTLLLPAGCVERIIPAAGVQIANAAGAEASWISTCKLMAVPVPELPIEGGIALPRVVALLVSNAPT